MRINKSIFRYIEHELYNYQQTKKDLEAYREEITEGTPITDVKSKNIGDTTASKAVQLTSSVYIIKAEKTITAIEKALELLSENHKVLFRLKYSECLLWREVYLEMNLSDRSYFRLRREIVIAVGQQLGLINICQ